MTNEIRECQECETILTEGFEFEEAAFCYNCAKKLGIDKQWKVFYEFRYITNRNNESQVHKVYVVHDNVYFSRPVANDFNDGKDTVGIRFILARPDDIIYEGGQLDNYVWGMTEEEVEEIDND